MGWLDGAAWRVGGRIARGIGDASSDTGGVSVSGYASRFAPASPIGHRCAPERRPSIGRAHGGPIGSDGSAIGAGRSNFGATGRDESVEIACAARIAANREKNPRITRSQRAADPDPRSAYATVDDMAWRWLLTSDRTATDCGKLVSSLSSSSRAARFARGRRAPASYY